MTNALPHLEPACTGKQAFASYTAASRAIRPGKVRVLSGRGDIHPYRCSICRAWHIGSNSLRERRPA